MLAEFAALAYFLRTNDAQEKHIRKMIDRSAIRETTVSGMKYESINALMIVPLLV